jgi:hypothetical protein
MRRDLRAEEAREAAEEADQKASDEKGDNDVQH